MYGEEMAEEVLKVGNDVTNRVQQYIDPDKVRRRDESGSAMIELLV